MEAKTKTDPVADRKKTIYRFLFPALAALLLELFVFNFRSIQSLFLTEQEYPLDQMAVKSLLQEGDIYRLAGEEPAFYLSGLQERCGTQKLHNIRIEFSLPCSEDVPYMESKVLRIRPYVSDEGREFFTQLADHICREDIPQSSFLWLNGMGAIKTVALRPLLSNGDAIRIQRIVLNAHRPLAISPVRLLVLFMVLLLGLGLKRKNVLYRPVEQTDRWTEIVAVCVMALFLLGPACYLIGQNEYLRDYVHFNPYHKLAERLAAGEVTLAEEPPEWLKAMENPYDDTLRTVLEEESGESFLWDYAYFKGHYYVYFGIIPCLLFYLPFYLLTGAHLSNAAVVIATAFLTLAGLYCLMKQIALRLNGIRSVTVVMLTILIWLGIQIPFFLNQPDAYAVPVLCGEMFTVWGLYFWSKAAGVRLKKGTLYRILGSFCMALVAGCRPNMVLYSFLILPLYWNDLRYGIEEWKKGKKTILKELLCLGAPYLPVAAGLMYYNAIRFGNPFDFGFAYNLTVHDSTRTVWSLDKLWIGIYDYMLRLPDLDYVFPYMSIPGDGTEQNLLGHTVVHMEYIFAGLLPCNLFLFFIVELFTKNPKDSKYEKRLQRAGITALVCGLLLALLDSQMAGIVYRYMADFSPGMLIAAAIAVMLVKKRLAGTGAEKLLRYALIVICLVSVFFHCNFIWLSGLKYPLKWGNTALYYRLYYTFMFW